MTSRKARCFRAIFTQNFLQIHTFFMKYWYFSKLSCDKKNLKWIFISYSIYETHCVFYIPSPKARGYKTYNSFHKYRMKWKFISDPIYTNIMQHFGYLYMNTICIAKCLSGTNSKILHSVPMCFHNPKNFSLRKFFIQTCQFFIAAKI